VNKFVKSSRQLRTKLIAILLGLTGTLAAGVGFYYGIYERLGLERLAVDFRFRYFNRDLSGSDKLCIVAIDDSSLADIGQWPWPRTYLAQIINLLDDLDSRAVLVDLIFSTPKSTEESDDESEDLFAGLGEDDALAQACGKQGQTLFACYFTDGPASSAIFDLLVEDFSLRPEALAEKLDLPLSELRNQFRSVRKLAARERMKQVLARDPKLDKFAAVREILGPNWISMTNQREELERAYDDHQAYAYLRYKSGSAGWMIEAKNLPPSIEQLPWTTRMELPTTKLAASCSDFGFVNFQPDPDGKVREVSLLGCYDQVIFRQLAFAGICRDWQVDPTQVKIYPDRLDFQNSSGEPSPNASLFATSQPSNITIPLNRKGKLILNWYAPHPNEWWRSFQTVSASGLLKIAFNRESLRKNQELLENAMPIAVKNFLPGSARQYAGLREKLAMMEESMKRDISEEADPPADIPSEETGTQPAISSTSQPATTIEEDLLAKIDEVHEQLAKIEAEAREQLDWLYRQLDTLSPAEQIAPENRLIHDLRQCLNHPDAVEEINANLQASIDRQLAEVSPMIRDRIVLIGYTGSTTADFVPTPVFNRCPGVMVHATLLNQLQQKAFLTESDRNTDLLIILVLGTLVSILSAQRSAVEALIWMLVFLVGFAFFTAYVVFGMLHVVSSMIGPMTAVAISWLLVSFYRQLTEGQARRLFAGRLSQYTSPALVRRITEDPRRMVLQPEQVKVSCYFSDLAGFTPLSEKLGPEQTVRFLNIYFEHMSEVLHANEAFINKFQGDGIFAFFNPPLNPQSDHARRACLSAIESHELPDHIENHLRKIGIELDSPLEMRIGISTGPAVVGDCGSARKFDYTCLGDTVNLGSRLESANKFFGTRILIDEATRKAMGEDLLARLMGEIRVAGRAQTIEVYELIGYREDHEDQLEFVELFEQMVRAYRQKNFNRLPAMLTQLETLHAGDKGVAIYRTMIERINQSGRQAWRDGIIEIELK
jgi:class 3 adenylate cyclase/CHASE2 domain-containing sensor protein